MAVREAQSAVLLFCCSAALAQPWSHFARGPDRVGSVVGPAPDISAPVWLANHDPLGAAIIFVGQSGVVADAGHVYGVGTSSGQALAYAMRRTDGEVDWVAAVPPAWLGSWSTPAIDEGNAALIVAAGTSVRAFSLADGGLRWGATPAKPIVNASPLVTGDLAARDRVFITDFDGSGADGRLYCINADPFDAALNPWQPGGIVWSAVIGGSSGNTPAYADGVVYVASAGAEPGGGPGLIHAFDATATASPTPLWTFTNVVDHGFFGGVCVHREGQEAFVYAASYAFSGGQAAANLVKVDASDGSLVWSVACNRTDATPIPLGDGRIVLSGGVVGFGSMPSVQMFRDTGSSAEMLWDTALETWVDGNLNGVMEVGEFLLVGGWTHQPAAVTGPAGAVLYAGAAPTGNWGAACTDLYALDLSREPTDPGFVVAHAIGTGSTPAVAGRNVYTIGAGGVTSFGPVCYADCTGDAALTVADFGCFQTRFVAGDPYADCNGDAALTVADFGCFQTEFVGGCP